MSKHIEPSQDQLAEIMKLPTDKPVVMINLLKFKERTEDGLTTGPERYMEYSQKVMPFLQESGGEVLYMGQAQANIIGPSTEVWHHVVLVKYASILDFFKMIQTAGYPHKLRNTALEDSRLIPSI